jgi:four helix bundle protein
LEEGEMGESKEYLGKRDKNPENLSDRLFNFALNTLKLLLKIPYRKEYEVLRYQLSKSATSIGANYEESQAGSYGEFKQRIQICLREARETYYWLRLLNHLDYKSDHKSMQDLERLLQESKEIKLIFGSISSRIKDKIKEER